MVSSSTNKLGHQIICCGWNKSCSVCAIEYYFVEGVYYMLFNLYRKEPFEETVWKKRIYVAGTRTDYINADSIHCRFEDLSKNIQMHCMQLCFLSKIQTCCQSERWHPEMDLSGQVYSLSNDITSKWQFALMQNNPTLVYTLRTSRTLKNTQNGKWLSLTWL